MSLTTLNWNQGNHSSQAHQTQMKLIKSHSDLEMTNDVKAGVPNQGKIGNLQSFLLLDV